MDEHHITNSMTHAIGTWEYVIGLQLEDNLQIDPT